MKMTFFFKKIKENIKSLLNKLEKEEEEVYKIKHKMRQQTSKSKIELTWQISQE